MVLLIKKKLFKSNRKLKTKLNIFIGKKLFKFNKKMRKKTWKLN